MICDFCSSPDPPVEYVSKDFGVVIAPGVTTTSLSSWMACEECHQLIAKQDWIQLEHRSYAGYLTLNPDSPPHLEQMLRSFWKNEVLQKFLANRTGEVIISENK